VGLGSIESPAAAVLRALRIIGGDSVTQGEEDVEAEEFASRYDAMAGSRPTGGVSGP